MSNESLILSGIGTGLNGARCVGSMLGYKPVPHDSYPEACLPVEISFTRASTGMEFVNGLWQSAAINMPRRYNDSYLFEALAENKALGSQLLDFVTYWTYSAGAGTYTDQGISPLFAASTNVHSWLFTATGGRPFILQSIALVSGTTYTFSVNFEIATTSTYDNCIGVLSGGAAISGIVIKNNGVIKPESDVISAGFVEFTFLCNYTGSHQFRVGLGVGDVTTGTMQISHPQMELGSVATSPIVSSGSAVTRLADAPSNIATTGVTQITQVLDDVTTVITSIPSPYVFPEGKLSSLIFE